VLFEGIQPQHLHQMDGIILNFEHILENFDAKVITFYQGQIGPSFERENWKLKLSSV
jgi:hypothetical protein